VTICYIRADRDEGGSTIAAHHLLHQPLDVRVEEQGDTAVVLISGACDASCHAQFREGLLDAEGKDPRHLVLDLTCLGFIDSIGLRVVIAAWNRARHAGHAFSVALASSGQVRRVFELTGVDQIVPVADPGLV
jgi:stage II sporulation protein AA (anti-sigma F factor antagonist)